MEEAEELSISQEVLYEAPTRDRAQTVELVRRWGGAASDAVLDPAIKFFSEPGIHGLMGYRREMGCAVVFGDPICAPEDRASLTIAFHRFAKEQGISIVYIAASKSFTMWAMQTVCGALIEFGEELVFDPAFDPRKRTGTHGSLVRRKVKQALREGITVQEHLSDNLEIERAIEQVGVLWLKSRKGAQIHISNVYLFDDRFGKRWFYAKLGDRVVGSISLNQLQAHQGWLINHLMVLPEAPNGTHELLLVSALEALDKQGCRHASIGMVAAQQLGEITGLSKVSTWIARTAFKAARKFLELDGLQTFWGKFHPESKPSYLLFSRNHIGIRELLGISRAMNGPI